MSIGNEHITSLISPLKPEALKRQVVDGIAVVQESAQLMTPRDSGIKAQEDIPSFEISMDLHVVVKILHGLAEDALIQKLRLPSEAFLK